MKNDIFNDPFDKCEIMSEEKLMDEIAILGIKTPGNGTTCFSEHLSPQST